MGAQEIDLLGIPMAIGNNPRVAVTVVIKPAVCGLRRNDDGSDASVDPRRSLTFIDVCQQQIVALTLRHLFSYRCQLTFNIDGMGEKVIQINMF